MKIIARIEKLAADQYRYNGRTFDSFVGARREMLNQTRERWTKARARHSAGFGSLPATGTGSEGLALSVPAA